MLNNKGWGTKDVMMTICVMAIAVLTTMIIYNRNFKDLFEGTSNKESVPTIEYNYVKAENQIENAAKDYCKERFQNIEDIPLMSLSYKFLKEKGYIESLDANDESCNGYVTIKSQNGKIIYDPYIKCENYRTEGYTASLNS